MILNYDDFRDCMREKFLINGNDFDENVLLNKCTELVTAWQPYVNVFKILNLTPNKVKAEFYTQFSKVKSFTDFLMVDVEEWTKQYIDFHKKNEELSKAIAKEYYEVETEIYFDERLNYMDVFNGKAKHPIKSETYKNKGKLSREDGPAIIEYDRQGNITKEEYWIDGIQYTDMLKYSVMAGSKKVLKK